MAIPLTVNGQVFQYPQTNNVSWGPDATGWAAAVTSGMLQKSGGLFLLLADVDFGPNFGLISTYFTSRTLNSAAAGALRLAHNDSVSWRNFANSADLALTVSNSDTLLFNGTAIGNFVSVLDTTTIDLTLSAGVLSAIIINGSITNAMVNSSAAIAYSKLNLAGSIVNSDITAGTITNASISATAAIAYSKLVLTGSIVNGDIAAGAITNASVNSAAAIAYSKLALTGSIVNADVATGAAIAVNKLAALTVSRAVVTDGSGILSAATTTATEIGYVNGVTSSIQTQFSNTQPLDSDLTAIAAMTATGIPVQTAVGAWSQRTITGTTSQVAVTNGNGVAGNPIIGIATDPILPGLASLTLPTGTTGQRPGTPTVGMIRYNTTLAAYEVYNGAAWAIVGTTFAVSFQGRNTAGTAVGTSFAKVPFTVITDTASGWSAVNNEYTFPVSGLYLITWNLSTASVNLSTAQTFNSVCSVPGGVDLADGSIGTGTGVSTAKSSVGHYTGTFASTTKVALFDVSSVATTLNTSNSGCNFAITRIG